MSTPPLQEILEQLRQLRADVQTQALQKPTMTVEEAWLYLDCHRSKLYNLIKSGDLQAAPKIGRKRTVTRESVERYRMRGIIKPLAKPASTPKPATGSKLEGRALQEMLARIAKVRV